LSSRNYLILNGVFHVSEIRKNLISTSLLVQQGYKVVFESNRVVITKHGVLIGKKSLILFLLIKYLINIDYYQR